MASTKSEKVERASPAPAELTPTDRTEPASMARSAELPARRTERGELRDLLGDYTEQTGAHFG